MYRFAALTLAAGLLLALPAHAHSPSAESRPAPSRLPVAAFQGVVHSIVVVDAATGAETRFNGIVGANGVAYLLQGSATAGVKAGATYNVHGNADSATLFAESADLVQGARADVPTKEAGTTFSGTLRLGHADNFDGQPSTFFFALVSDEGHHYPLKLGSELGILRNGAAAVVTGSVDARGALLAVRIVMQAAPAAQDKSIAVAAAATTNKVLVIPIKFPTNTASPYTYAADPFTVASLQTAVFGASPTQSAGEFYRDVSYGQHLLTGVVANVSAGWLKAASPPTGAKGCDIDQISSLAEAAATAAGYSLANYDNLMYVFESNSFNCGWSGLAYIGWGRAYIKQTTNLLVIGHELGHNFGLLHAASLDCGTATIGGTCTSAEYGDPFDVMGNNRAMHFNLFQKSSLGWVAPTTVTQHTSGTATYTIYPLESPGMPLYGVSVGANRNRTYWIEFRQPLGFDSGISAFPNNGAQIHVAAPFEGLCSGCADDTEYLDLTPATTVFTDGALLPGQTFTDEYGVQIAVLSASATSLSVQVTAPSRPSFSDVPANFWAYNQIESVYWSQVTAGCAGSPLRFCPTNIVTRAEMAVFIERLIHGHGYTYTPTGKVFGDVPLGFWAGGPIEQFYADGIDPGCSTNPLLFCPTATISRAQMAVMLVKGFYGASYTPPAATGKTFTDVPATYPQAAWIEQLYRMGVTVGCTATTYCPDGTITRAEMAVFLTREWTLPSPP